MDFPLLISSLLAILATTFLLLFKLFSNKNVGRKPPEASGAWPIIGHLPVLLASNDSLPHKVLAKMAEKHGPIFRMRLGAHETVVVSDSRIARECFTTQDTALAGRPRAIAIEHIGYNFANFGFATYGQYWRNIRKVVMLELLSKRRLEILGRVRESGVKAFMKDIYSSCSEDDAVLDMQEMFGGLVMDILMRMLFGQRYKDEDGGGSWRATNETIRKSFELSGVTLVGDYLPWLRWLDIGGHEKAIKETAKDMDRVMDIWLQQHKRTRHSKPKDEEDFMDALLSNFDNKDNKNIHEDFDADTIIKATSVAVLEAATDTTAITLTWAVSLLLNNPSSLEKVRGELDSHVGRERTVNELDINNLTYLQAVVKETLRLYPPGPLLLPHQSIEDCTVGGYRITKGIRVLVNAYMIHRDPKFWSEADAFKPERFLSDYKEVDVRGNHFDLIPFGGGRRICPGITLGLQSVHLALANLIHGFDLRKIDDEPIDMTESPGLSIGKATPLRVILKPRLSTHHLYDN